MKIEKKFTTAKLLFHFKTKGIPYGESVRTYVSRDNNYPNVIHIERRFVYPKDAPLHPELKVLREGNKYRLVSMHFAFIESSLHAIFYGLIDESDSVFELIPNQS